MRGLGKLSATAVQEIAHAAVNDGVDAEELHELASLGTWGEHPGNTHRDLRRLLTKKINQGRLGGLQESPSFRIKVPALDSKEDKPESMVDFPALAAHLFGLDKVHQFWAGVQPDDPRLTGSPIDLDKARNAEKQVIPLWLHGAFSFGPCLYSPASSGLKQSQVVDHAFCLAAFPKSAQLKHTWQHVYQILAWSFQALFHGTHPSTWWLESEPLPPQFKKMAGKPIIERGHTFLVWQYQGDLENFANVLGMPHWNKPDFCWLCNCHWNLKHRSPWDFQDSPNWQLLTPRGLKESQSSSNPFLTKIPGCAQQYRVAIDTLHTVDLGVAATNLWLNPSYVVIPGGWQQKRCPPTTCLKCSEISEACKILKIAERFTNITINQFTNGEKPWSQKPLLKGKAAELRHLAPVLALVAWNKAKHPAGTLAQEGTWNKAKETQVALHIAEALTSLACFYDILAGADVFRTNEEAMEACNKAKKCLQHYVWLKAAIDDDLRW